MTHEQIQEQLSEWLDGELDPAASADASRHIDACASCQADVARLKRLGAALFKTLPAADPRSTEAFVARVMARVETDAVSPWERFAGRWLAPAFGLALAGLLAGILLPELDAELPLDAQLLADGRGALPSYDGFLEAAP